MNSSSKLCVIRTVQHRGLSTKFLGLDRPLSWTVEDPDLCQFNGIKYGNIKARFQQATLNETFPSTYDATKYGPKCPQIVPSPRLEDALIGIPPSNVPQHAADIFDEFNCLNLNIITPHDAYDGADYPVMIYFHGGGGYVGSNSDWFCDGGAIASLAKQIGKPVVHVAINYRLSALGHLGSTELQIENGKISGGNFGYQDMHLAIEWVHKHIGPFGGSSSEITIYGESFGSLGVEAQIHSLLPARFSRCILQSEVLHAPVFTTPESVSTKSLVYEEVKRRLSVKTVKELQEVPWKDLLTAFAASDPRAGLPLVPMIDGIFFGQGWKDQYSFTRGRRGKVMIGNTSAEGSVVRQLFSTAPKTIPPQTKALIDALYSKMNEEKLLPMQLAYQILDSPTVSLSQLKTNIFTLIEDMMWYQPTADTITGLMKPRDDKKKSTVYQYSFEQPNPFKGPFKGVPNHALDLAYLHGDPRIFEQTENAETERNIESSIKQYWILFADGEEPWDNSKVLQIGPFGVQKLETEAFLKENRKSENWKVLERFTFAEKGILASLFMAHLAQMSSIE